MESASATDGQRGVRRPGFGVALVQYLTLVAAAAVIVLTAHSAHWSVAPLSVIAIFSILSDLTAVDTDAVKTKIAGSFLGIMLAAVAAACATIAG